MVEGKRMESLRVLPPGCRRGTPTGWREAAIPNKSGDQDILENHGR